MMLPPPQPEYRTHPGNCADSALESARKCINWGWSLVGGGCVTALIPFVGVVTWFIGPPLIVTGFVLAIVAIAKGRTSGGICLLLFSMLVAPFAVILGPIVSSLIGVAASTDVSSPPKLPDMLQSYAPASAPATEAEMAAEREEIQRQLDSKARSGR